MNSHLKLDIIDYLKTEGKNAFNASDFLPALNLYHKALTIYEFIIPEDDGQ
jgi:hypothetical protein